MSTVPRHPTDTTNTQPRAIVVAASSEIEDAVREFEAAAECIDVDCPSEAELRQLCRQVASFTAELFPRITRIQVKNDPELPDELYILFAVDASGPVDDVLALNDQWHRRVISVEGKWHGLFRLAIDTH